MKRYLLAALTLTLLLAAVLILSACGGGDEPADTTAPATQAPSGTQAPSAPVTTADTIIFAESVTLDKKTLTLTEGNNATLTATVAPANATEKALTWVTSDVAVVSVVDGKVTALKAGTAMVIVSAPNGKLASCMITVQKATVPLDALQLNKTSLSLQIGNVEELAVALSPMGASGEGLSWKSSNTEVVRVYDGAVVAVGAGTATVTVTAGDQKTASCTVTVTGKQAVTVSGISLSQTSLALTKGNSGWLLATVNGNSYGHTIVWASSDTAVAKVNTDGRVTAVAAGRATITAMVQGSTCYAVCDVVVTETADEDEDGLAWDSVAELQDLPEPTFGTCTGISSTGVLYVGVTRTELKAYLSLLQNSYGYQISALADTTYAYSGTGTKGSKTLTIGWTETGGNFSMLVEGGSSGSSGGGSTTDILPTRITLNKQSVTLNAGDYTVLSSTLAPTNATKRNVVWYTSNASVAYVKNGIVMAVGAGRATITAYTENGKVATCTVTVKTPVSAVVLDRENISLSRGDTLDLHVNVLPLNASDAGVTWASSDIGVVTVKNGKLTAVGAGTATVTATTATGESAECVVTVTVATAGISLNKATYTMAPNGSCTLTAAVTPQDASDRTVSFMTSDETILAVDENGNITAHENGIAIITATAADGSTAFCIVTVQTAEEGHVHTPSDWVIDKKATCKEEGSRHRNCTTCGDLIKRESIKKTTTHTSVTDPRVEPTETAPGLTAGSHCSVCGTVLVPQVVIAPKLQGTDIASIALKVEGETLTATLSNATDTFSFVSDIAVAGDASYVVARDIYCEQVFHSKNVPLEEGDNTFYLLVTNENAMKLYTVTLRRRPMYTVTVDKADGTTPATQRVEEGSTAIVAATATRTGYRFNGWSADTKAPITADTVFTAQWGILTYNITYALGGGTNADGNPATYTVEDTLPLAAPSRAGFRFMGWTLNGSPITEIAAGTTGNKTLTATWVPLYTVSYELSGGTNAKGNPSEYVTGEVLTLATPRREGYRFVGWKLNGEPTSGITADMAGDLTFTAVWESWGLYLQYQTSGGVTAITGLTSLGATLSEIEIPNEINGTKIDGVAYQAFYNCDNLVSVTVGSSTTIISAYAFEGCSKLTTVTFAEESQCTGIGDYAFYNCVRLASIVIPDSVKTIGNYAFESCDGLRSVIIGNGVTSIGKEAFLGCGLVTVTLGQSVSSIGTDAFDECDKLVEVRNLSDYITITRGGTGYGYVGYNALAVYNGTTTPSKLWQTDDGYLFYENGNACYLVDYTGIESELILPADCHGKGYAIRKYAFYNRGDVTSVTISAAVTSIGQAAFAGCSKLTEVAIPESVTSIEKNAFSKCSKLTIFCEAESKPSGWDSNWNYSDCPVVWGVIENGMTTDDILWVKTSSSVVIIGYIGDATVLTIPTTIEGVNVKSIGIYAFSGCSSLTSVTIPASVTSIGRSAFYGCSALESITLPFAGATKDGTSNTHFGYIFGASSYSYNDDYVPTSLKTVVITGGTSIGENAFYGCSALTEITISDSVTSIGSGAFYGCSSLKSIALPFVGGSRKTASDTYQYPLGYIFGTSSYEGGVATKQYYYGSSTSDTTSTTFYIPASLRSVTVTGGNVLYGAFYNCTSLTEITIPNSVTSIGSYAFRGCSSLTEITIPASVTSIGSYAFRGCTSLTSIAVDGNNNTYQSIDGNLHTKDGKMLVQYAPGKTATSFVIPAGVTSIGERSFYYCTSLTEVTIPTGVTSIGNSAFSGCSSLTEVHITDLASWCRISFASESANPLYYAKNLYLNGTPVTNLVISNGVTSIGNYAFSGCSSLTEITIPASVTSIGYYVFSGCSSLTEITIPASVTSIGYAVFSGCSSLTEITIPASVTSIGYNAFYKCSSLTSVTIPASVTSIGSSAFRGCSSLKSITLPFVGATKDGTSNEHFGYIFGASSYSYNGDYVPTSLKTVVITGGTSIYRYAFVDCYSLTSVTIPASVTSIGESAFYNCSSLTIYCEAAAKPRGWSSSWNNSNRPVVWRHNNITTDSTYNYVVHNGVAFLTKYKGGAKDVVIPATIGGYPIVGFGSIFFETDITSVTFAEGSQCTRIGYGAFSGCSSLTSVTIPAGVTSIGEYAFSDCSSLTSVTIPASVKSIGFAAFYNCTSLTSVHITDLAAWCGISFSVSTANPLCYAKNLYLNGTLITDLVIPTSVTSIRGYAFEGCSSLTKVTIPASVTSIGYNAFYKCSSLTSVTIPASVTDIRSYAFAYCSSLTEVTFAEGSKCKSIGDDAFRGCSSLTKVTIPDSVTSIGGGAFSGCSSLTSVTIPASVTSIGYAAFSHDSSLTIYCEVSSKPSGWDRNWNYSGRCRVVWGYKNK